MPSACCRGRVRAARIRDRRATAPDPWRSPSGCRTSERAADQARARLRRESETYGSLIRLGYGAVKQIAHFWPNSLTLIVALRYHQSCLGAGASSSPEPKGALFATTLDALQRARSHPSGGPDGPVRTRGAVVLLGDLLGTHRGEVVGVSRHQTRLEGLHAHVPPGRPLLAHLRRCQEIPREPARPALLGGGSRALERLRRRGPGGRRARGRRGPSARGARLRAPGHAAGHGDRGHAHGALPTLSRHDGQRRALHRALRHHRRHHERLPRHRAAGLGEPGRRRAWHLRGPDCHRGGPRRGHPGRHGLQLFRESHEALGDGAGWLHPRAPEHVGAPGPGQGREPLAMAFNLDNGGGGGGRRSVSTLAEINIIPLVDVVLVLLLIFMLTAPLMYRGIDVNLPTTAGKPTVTEERMELTLTKERQIYLNGKPLAPGALEEALRDTFKSRTDKTLYLKADQALQYGFVVETMDKVRRSGIEKLGMVTEPVRGS